MTTQKSNLFLSELNDMSKEKMLCYIRSHPRIKNNMRGFSSMKKEELKANLEKVLKGTENFPRQKTETEWMKALKYYNKGNDKFHIPKKGTDEYQIIKNIMDGKETGKFMWKDGIRKPRPDLSWLKEMPMPPEPVIRQRPSLQTYDRTGKIIKK